MECKKSLVSVLFLFYVNISFSSELIPYEQEELVRQLSSIPVLGNVDSTPEARKYEEKINRIGARLNSLVNWVCTVESQSDALVNINILKLNTNKKYRISCPLVNIKNHNKVFLEIYSDLKVYRGNSLKISGNSSSLMYALPVNSYFITLIDPKIELIGNKDASEIGRENRYFLTQMIGMQAYEYQEILKKNKKFIKISNSYKEQEISKFFKELDSYGKSDEVVKGQDFIIGENMMPHSGSLFLTFFINMKTGKTYYFKYEDCFTGVVCSDILVFGADETSRTDHSIDYTIPNEIRKWFKNKFGPRAEDRMVLGQ